MARPATSRRLRLAARRTIENGLRRQGFAQVAGADEVGRGALAGPVVAVAVVLDPCRHIAGLRDSKLLTASQREELYVEITAAARWAVASASPADVDRLNVHRASLDALRRAVQALDPPPAFALIDGFSLPGLDLPQRGIVGGDRRCAAIAAASIVAKVVRDREMVRLHGADPRYGFDRHKGYATRVHLDAVARFGYSDVHRRSFRPRALQ